MVRTIDRKIQRSASLSSTFLFDLLKISWTMLASTESSFIGLTTCRALARLLLGRLASREVSRSQGILDLSRE